MLLCAGLLDLQQQRREYPTSNRTARDITTRPELRGYQFRLLQPLQKSHPALLPEDLGLPQRQHQRPHGSPSREGRGLEDP